SSVTTWSGRRRSPASIPSRERRKRTPAPAGGPDQPEGEMAEKFRNFIGGEWVEPTTGEYFENRNPADTDDLIGLFPRSGREDLERAVASAKVGFEKWRSTPAPERGAILRRVGDIMTARKDEIARIATREMGKVLEETRGDVQE